MTDTDLYTIYAMGEQGGSFVQALARAALLADPENLQRLKTAFPEYWETYHPNLSCGCRYADRDLCGHGNAPLA
jgi:hypothetical protein